MAQSRLQSTETDTVATVASLSKAFGSNNTVNGLLVYSAVWDAASPNPTISDTGNAGNIVSAIGPTTTGDGVTKIQTWHVLNCVAGANTVQLSWGAPNPTFSGLTISEYTDSATHTNGFTKDQIASNTSNSTNPTSGATPATTQATEIVYGFCVNNTGLGSDITAGSGFAIGPVGTTFAQASEDKFVTSTGAQTAAFTDATSGQWAAHCVTYFTAAVSVASNIAWIKG